MWDMLKLSTRSGLFAILVASSVVLAALAVWKPLTSWAEYEDDERARRVLVNAFAVANPGYFVDYLALSDDAIEVDPEGGTITLPLSPRLPYLASSPQRHRSFHTLRLASPMAINAAPLDATLTQEAIRKVQSGAFQPPAARNNARELLLKVPAQVLATAVVGLDAELRETDLGEGQTIAGHRLSTIILRTSEGISFTWSGGACGTMGFDCGAEGNAPLSEFRHWVGSLRDEDAAALQAFGLALPALRQCARTCVIKGYAIAAAPQDLLKIADGSGIRSFHLTDFFLDY